MKDNLKKQRVGLSAGFTLVELIVVIAILGILAGVGTVAYSGYVKRANKAVDQQLVADTEYAVALAGAANNLGSKAGSGVLGYIILSDTDPVVVKDTLTTDDGTSTTYLEDAMKAAFGEDYAGTLKLKYSGWTDAATMLNEVASNPYAASVNSSSYINNVGTEKLLTDVQNCTTKLSEFMKQFSGDNNDAEKAYEKLASCLPAGVLEQLYTEAGMTAADSTLETLGNATVICISDYVSNNQESVMKSFYDGVMVVDGAVQPTNTDYILAKDLSKIVQSADRTELLTTTATWYAAGEAAVAYLDDPECTELFQKIEMGSDKSSLEIVSSMQTQYTAIANKINSDPTLKAKFAEYYTAPEGGKSQAQLDGESYVAIMSTVNNLSDDYTNPDDLKTKNLFSSSAMVNRIDSYVAAATLSELLTDPSHGDLSAIAGGSGGSSVVIIVTADGNGNVGSIACPSDAVF